LVKVFAVEAVVMFAEVIIVAEVAVDAVD